MVVYFHRNPVTYEIFYVGIGNSKRPFRKDDRNKFWHNTVNKYGNPIIQIVHQNISKTECIKWEIYYIKLLKRRFEGGLLVNLTAGGEAGSDDPELRKENSERMKDFFKKNPEAKNNLSFKLKQHFKENPYVHTPNRIIAIDKMKGDNHPSKRPEVINKIRKGNLGRVFSPETLQKMSKAKIGIKLSREHIEKVRSIHIGRKNSLEVKLKMRESQSKNCVKVSMVNKENGDVVAVFNSISEAARYLGKDNGMGNIVKSINNTINYAYGYRWKINN